MTRSRELPSGNEKIRAVRDMFDRIAPRYDLVNRVMTFGMDTRWRRRTVEALGLEAGSLVLDVACGTGDLCRELERNGLRAIGTDFSAGMLGAARTEAPLVQGDALALPVRDGSIDGVTCGFALRNVADLSLMLREFARVLRPGGRLSVLEVSEPRSAPLRYGHRLYFHRVVPIIGGLLSNRDAYRYLPASTAYLPPREGLLEMFRNAGFDDVATRQLGFGAAQLISGARS
jgi:demethylmenaquinone methyltransferase/2-methoxy-6-polyprenyl-1,4-benzoquinol methylase